MSAVQKLAERARAASRVLARTSTRDKDAALRAIAASLRSHAGAIGDANRVDLERARASGLSEAMLDRLTLSAKSIEAMARSVEDIANLPDPVGSRGPMRRLASGLMVGKQRLPLGVIAMIYESRPNVTVDASALCLKAGNAVLLRGGSEAAESNRVLGEVLAEALGSVRLPEALVQIVPPGDRENVLQMLSLAELIDLAIPRGGAELVRFVSEHARVPVLKHYRGVCHLFLDKDCNHEQAIALAVNGKAQRPGTCNALECLLVHRTEAPALLPKVADALIRAGVELRGCEETCALVKEAIPATEADFGHEFLAKVLAVRVVAGIDAALEHIERYGSNHTEVICTRYLPNAERWLNEVDAGTVMVNASPRLNDGGELGLGAEIGISVSKVHAYGPMGLDSLTAEKFVVMGYGQLRN